MLPAAIAVVDCHEGVGTDLGSRSGIRSRCCNIAFSESALEIRSNLGKRDGWCKANLSVDSDTAYQPQALRSLFVLPRGHPLSRCSPCQAARSRKDSN